MLTRKRIKKGLVYALTAFLMLLMFIRPVERNAYQSLSTDTIHYEHGIVREVVEEELSTSEVEPSHQLGVQVLKVELEDGTLEEINNYLTDTHNILAEAGTRIVVCADTPEGTEPYYTVYNYNRTIPVTMLAAVFLLLMLFVGRLKGFDASLAILFSLVLLLRFTLPMLYNGTSPLLVGFVSTLAVTGITLLLLHGITLRAALASIVTLGGECVAVGLYAIAEAALHIGGFQTDAAETLIVVAQNTGLQLKYVLLSSTMIAALGAVMDVAVSLLSALWELKTAQPEMPAKNYIRSGLNIGRDMIGTMSNTLIFAFAGNSMATMLSLFSYGVQAEQLLNSDYVAMELAQGLCGTCAVILTVPLAAVTAAIAFPRMKIPDQGSVQNSTSVHP